ncbi:glycolipid transfer protein domain-containing protein 2 [Aplochiton taeniatus]
MGVKGKAALAIVVLFMFLGSLWLQGSLDYHWDSCLKNYKQLNKLYDLSNRSEGAWSEDGLPLGECHGQAFQVGKLLTHLLEAQTTTTNDVLMQPYLASWDELILFMEALGPMVGLISQEIDTKTSIIRQLALAELESPEAEVEAVGGRADPGALFSGGSAYLSVRSMIRTELGRGLVDFDRQNDSGCRTLLRLHRALLWLQLFLEKLGETPAEGRLKSPSELCRQAYHSTLAHHHTWFVRRAADLAFIAMPERGFFYRLMCVQNQAEASVVLSRVVRALGDVYDRTEVALEENHMLDLP